MKIFKKLVLFLALISLFYSISLIQSAYAKYVTSATTNSYLTIARWNILVNNQDIRENSNFSETIVPTFTGSTNIKDNVVAPTSEGYFELVFDGSGTDVGYNYTVQISPTDENTVTDFIIKSYEVDGISHEYEGGSITGSVPLTSESKITTIKVNLEWKDGTEDETMNNEQDTAASKDGNLSYNVSVNFIQINDKATEESTGETSDEESSEETTVDTTGE